LHNEVEKECLAVVDLENVNVTDEVDRETVVKADRSIKVNIHAYPSTYQLKACSDTL